MCKILVIDDEKVIINIIQQLLEMNGYDVDTAGDGDEGIQKFDNDCFDLVITDICMPGVDGNGVAKHIRDSAKKYVPVIGMSGTPWGFEDKRFDTIFEKPFQLKALMNTVEELIPLNSKIAALG
ncbi:MAG: response regulator [Thermodesulfobacteriota bacterium]|nr:response regulator [Thermodesulfobacteriota bacterium]